VAVYFATTIFLAVFRRERHPWLVVVGVVATLSIAALIFVNA
jgi:hypothetical protein